MSVPLSLPSWQPVDMRPFAPLPIHNLPFAQQQTYPPSRSASPMSADGSLSSGNSAGSNDREQGAKKKRRRTTPGELLILEDAFRRTPLPDQRERQEIARKVAMDQKAIQIWFQNRRFTEAVGGWSRQKEKKEAMLTLSVKDVCPRPVEPSDLGSVEVDGEVVADACALPTVIKTETAVDEPILPSETFQLETESDSRPFGRELTNGNGNDGPSSQGSDLPAEIPKYVVVDVQGVRVIRKAGQRSLAKGSTAQPRKPTYVMDLGTPSSSKTRRPVLPGVGSDSFLFGPHRGSGSLFSSSFAGGQNPSQARAIPPRAFVRTASEPSSTMPPLKRGHSTTSVTSLRRSASFMSLSTGEDGRAIVEADDRTESPPPTAPSKVAPVDAIKDQLKAEFWERMDSDPVSIDLDDQKPSRIARFSRPGMGLKRTTSSTGHLQVTGLGRPVFMADDSRGLKRSASLDWPSAAASATKEPEGKRARRESDGAGSRMQFGQTCAAKALELKRARMEVENRVARRHSRLSGSHLQKTYSMDDIRMANQARPHSQLTRRSSYPSKPISSTSAQRVQEKAPPSISDEEEEEDELTDDDDGDEDDVFSVSNTSATSFATTVSDGTPSSTGSSSATKLRFRIFGRGSSGASPEGMNEQDRECAELLLGLGGGPRMMSK